MPSVRRLVGEVEIRRIKEAYTELKDMVDIMGEIDGTNMQPSLDHAQVVSNLNQLATAIDGTKKKIDELATNKSSVGLSVQTDKNDVVSQLKAKLDSFFSALPAGSGIAEKAIYSTVYAVGGLTGQYGKWIDYSKHVATVTNDITKMAVDPLRSALGGLQDRFTSTIDKMAESKAAIAGIGTAMAGLVNYAGNAAQAYDNLEESIRLATEGMSASQSKETETWIRSATTPFVGTQSRANMAMMAKNFGIDMTDVQKVVDLYGAKKESFEATGMTPETMLRQLGTVGFRAMGASKAAEGPISTRLLGGMVGDAFWNDEAFGEFKDQMMDQVGDQYEDNPGEFERMVNQKWATLNLKKVTPKAEGESPYKDTVEDQTFRLNSMMSGSTRALGGFLSPTMGTGMRVIIDGLQAINDNPVGNVFFTAATAGKELISTGLNIAQQFSTLILSYALMTTSTAANTAATTGNVAARGTLLATMYAEIVAGIRGSAMWIANTAAKSANMVINYGLSLATGIVTAAQWLLNIALTANPIGLVIVGVAALIAILAGLVYWMSTASERTDWLSKSFVSAQAFMGGLADGGVKRLRSGVEWLTNGFKYLYDVITGVRSLDMGEIGKMVIGGAISLLLMPLTIPLTLMQGFLSVISRWKLPDWLQNIIDRIQAGIDWILSLPEQIWNFIRNGFDRIVQTLTSLPESMGRAIRGALGLSSDEEKGRSASESAAGDQVSGANPGAYVPGPNESKITPDQWAISYLLDKSFGSKTVMSGEGKEVGKVSDLMPEDAAIDTIVAAALAGGRPGNTGNASLGYDTWLDLIKAKASDNDIAQRAYDKVSKKSNLETDIAGNEYLSPKTFVTPQDLQKLAEANMQYPSTGSGLTRRITPDGYIEISGPNGESIYTYEQSHDGSRISKGGIVNVAAGQEIPGPASLIKGADTPLRQLLTVLTGGSGNIGGGAQQHYHTWNVVVQQLPGGNLDMSDMRRQFEDMIKTVSINTNQRSMRIGQA